MEQRRDVFQAIADPTRREIIALLTGGSLNVGTLAEQFDMSRQAVSLHVKILEECGVLEVTREGRERHCAIRIEKLDEVSGWIERLRGMWETRFDQLDEVLKHLKSVKNEN